MAKRPPSKSEPQAQERSRRRRDGALVGVGAKIDAAARLNHPTGRKIGAFPTRLGERAIVRAGAVIYVSVVIGARFECGHGTVIREENVLGDDCAVWSNSCVDYGCRIGDRVKIHNNVYLAQFTTVEDDVFIGPGVTTTNDRHPVCTKCMKGPTIRRRARIGGGAALLPGVEIGESALVGAGAVVVRDVPPFAVVAGNPARVIGDVRKLRCRCGEKDLAYPEDR